MKFEVKDTVKFPDDPAIGRVVAIGYVPARAEVAVRWPGMAPYRWTWHLETELELVERWSS